MKHQHEKMFELLLAILLVICKKKKGKKGIISGHALKVHRHLKLLLLLFSILRWTWCRGDHGLNFFSQK